MINEKREAMLKISRDMRGGGIGKRRGVGEGEIIDKKTQKTTFEFPSSLLFLSVKSIRSLSLILS